MIGRADHLVFCRRVCAWCRVKGEAIAGTRRTAGAWRVTEMGRVDGSEGLGFGKERLLKDREMDAVANSPTTQRVLPSSLVVRASW